MNLTIYKLIDGAKFIAVAFVAFSALHVLWTIVAGLTGIERGY